MQHGRGVVEVNVAEEEERSGKAQVQMKNWWVLKAREGKEGKDEVSGEIQVAVRFTRRRDLDASDSPTISHGSGASPTSNDIHQMASEQAGALGPVFKIITHCESLPRVYAESAVPTSAFAQSLSKYAGAIHLADDSSLLERAMLTMAEVIQHTLELRESLVRDDTDVLLPLVVLIKCRTGWPFSHCFAWRHPFSLINRALHKTACCSARAHVALESKFRKQARHAAEGRHRRDHDGSRPIAE